MKEGEKGKNFDKKVNNLTRYKIGGSRRGTFFFVHFFFANSIPSSARPAVRILPRPLVVVWSSFPLKHFFWVWLKKLNFFYKMNDKIIVFEQKQKTCEWENFFVWNFSWNLENFELEFLISSFYFKETYCLQKNASLQPKQFV